jgi:hypothetical protein
LIGENVLQLLIELVVGRQQLNCGSIQTRRYLGLDFDVKAAAFVVRSNHALGGIKFYLQFSDDWCNSKIHLLSVQSERNPIIGFFFVGKNFVWFRAT